MSIVDGQVVLLRHDSSAGASSSGSTGSSSGSGSSSSGGSSSSEGTVIEVDPQASVSRIGSRAYPPALAELAVQLRFELAQVTPVQLCSLEIAAPLQQQSSDHARCWAASLL